MVYLSSDHFSSLPPLYPISSYFHFHEDDCSILLTGLVSCTCTPVVHCPQRSLSNPYKALSLLSSKPCNGSISLRSKSKVFTMVHEAHLLWLLAAPLSLPVPLQPHWTLNCSYMQQVPSGLGTCYFICRIDLPTDTQMALPLSPSSSSWSKVMKKIPVYPLK